MVQWGLLSANPGSAHSGGEAPGDQSSLRQGAGTSSSSDLDLGIKEAAEQWRISRCGYFFRVSVPRGKYRGKEGQRGAPPPPESLLARPGVGPRHMGAWVGVGPLRLPF